MKKLLAGLSSIFLLAGGAYAVSNMEGDCCKPGAACCVKGDACCKGNSDMNPKATFIMNDGRKFQIKS